MSPKMGRPKSDNPKCIDVKVRIDDDLNKRLLVYSKENNITRAEAIRRGIEEIMKK